MSFLDCLIARMRFSEALSFVRILEKQRGHKLRILDLGGAGFLPGKSFAERLRKAGHQVVIGDIAGTPDVFLDMNKPLPFKDDSFDLVVSLAVVEHLENWRIALEEMKRVGQAVIFTTPSPISKKLLEFMAGFGLIDGSQVHDHKHYLSMEEIREAGYEVSLFQFGLNQVGYKGFEVESSLPVVISLTVFLTFFMAIVGGMPPDDLLRHLVSHIHGYDWRTVFPYTSLPSFDLWIGFEIFAGWINRLFHGNGMDWRLMQALCVLINVTGLFLVTRKVKDLNTRAFMVLLVTGLIWHRLKLGRPAEFMNGIMLILWGLDDVLPRMAKLVLGIAVAPLYWLWWIYMVPLLMLDMVYLAALLGGIAFWAFYGGKEYFDFIFSLVHSIHNSSVIMGENRGLFPAGLALGGFFLMAVRARDKRPLIAMLWFAMSNQLRYVESILSVSLASLKERNWKVHRDLYVCTLAIIMFSNLRGFSLHVSGKEDLSILRGRTVFCAHMGIMFYLVNRLKKIHLVPSFNMYGDSPEVPRIFRALSKTGKLRCDLLKKFDIDYVVDTWQFQKTPNCLTLKAIRGPFRIWQPVWQNPARTAPFLKNTPKLPSN